MFGLLLLETHSVSTTRRARERDRKRAREEEVVPPPQPLALTGASYMYTRPAVGGAAPRLHDVIPFITASPSSPPSNRLAGTQEYKKTSFTPQHHPIQCLTCLFTYLNIPTTSPHHFSPLNDISVPSPHPCFASISLPFLPPSKIVL